MGTLDSDSAPPASTTSASPERIALGAEGDGARRGGAGEVHRHARDAHRQRGAEDHLAARGSARSSAGTTTPKTERSISLGIDRRARHQLRGGDAREVDHVHVAEVGARLDERRAAAVDDGHAAVRPAQLAAARRPGRPAGRASRVQTVSARSVISSRARGGVRRPQRGGRRGVPGRRSSGMAVSLLSRPVIYHGYAALRQSPRHLDSALPPEGLVLRRPAPATRSPAPSAAAGTAGRALPSSPAPADPASSAGVPWKTVGRAQAAVAARSAGSGSSTTAAPVSVAQESMARSTGSRERSAEHHDLRGSSRPRYPPAAAPPRRDQLRARSTPPARRRPPSPEPRPRSAMHGSLTRC